MSALCLRILAGMLFKGDAFLSSVFEPVKVPH